MKLRMLRSLELALLLTTLSSVEGQTLPGSVSGLTGFAKFFTLELSWNPPQVSDGVITSYDVTYIVNGSSTHNERMVVTSDSQIYNYTISNLEPYTTISNITVTVYTVLGPGPSVQFSNTFVTLTEPPMVNNVVAEVLTNTSVRVSWDLLPLSEITVYAIFYSQSGNKNEQANKFVTAVSSTENSVDIIDLIMGAEYQFQVVAKAVVNTMVLVGQRSLLTCKSILLVILATSPPSTKCECIPFVSLVSSIGVTFFSTILLYSFILMMVLMACCCHRKRGNSSHDVLDNQKTTENSHLKNVYRKPVVQIAECESYGEFPTSTHAYPVPSKHCDIKSKPVVKVAECMSYGELPSPKHACLVHPETVQSNDIKSKPTVAMDCLAYEKGPGSEDTYQKLSLATVQQESIYDTTF